MHNKKGNINKSKNFIQGLRPFSSSLPHGLKKILKKGGYNFSNIVDNWTKMVGKDISKYCYPNTVKMAKDMSNGTLILNVVHGNEVNAEYKKQEIIDKLPPDAQKEFLKLAMKLDEKTKQTKIHDSFLDFVRHVWPQFIEGKHHQKIAEKFK